MTNLQKFEEEMIVVLDACVLYSAPLRDFLLYIAEIELYQPKWTIILQDEWFRNLLKNRADISENALLRTIKVMNYAFPNALVKDFESLIENIVLPDPDDRHVVACAIKANAKQIVTFNLKDFPAKTLATYNLKAIHPDKFIIDLLEINPQKVVQAFKYQVSSLRNPPLSEEKVLEKLEICGLVQSLKLLKTLL